MTSEYGVLNHFDARLQIVDLSYDQFHTSSDRVGQFSARSLHYVRRVLYDASLPQPV